MKSFALLLFTTVMLVSGAATLVLADDAAIASAIDNVIRTDADRKRDERSKPEVILGLLDLQPGQSVVDLFAGGGYYSELMAGVVGPDGTVIL
jgi:predicted methyltransferase